MAQGGHRKVGLVIAGNLLELTRVQDLVDRDFAAQATDDLWIADITYIPTWAGFLCLAVVIDAWSRRVVGWAMASHLRTELVLDALNMALAQRHPEDVIHQTKAASTRRSPSGNVASKLAYAVRWAQSVTAMTTPCVRVSSPHWNASCSSNNDSPHRPKRGWPSSTSSRAGTTPIDDIRAWNQQSSINFERSHHLGLMDKGP